MAEESKSSDRKNVLVMFDVDGTLTPARKVGGWSRRVAHVVVGACVPLTALCGSILLVVAVPESNGRDGRFPGLPA